MCSLESDGVILKIVESWGLEMEESVEKLKRIAVLAQMRNQARAGRAEDDSSVRAEEGVLEPNFLRMG